MLSVNDIVIDLKSSIGTQMLLTEISAVYKYEKNQRTDEIIGYKYTCALPAKRLKKIGVKIDGAQQMEEPTEGFIEVNFVDFELYFYVKDEKVLLGARARGIVPVKTK